MKPARLIPVLIATCPAFLGAEIIVRGGGVLLDHSLSQNQEPQENHPPKAPDPVGDDLILFENGDLMHGTFGGLDEGLIWNRKDISRPIRFGLPGVRQIVFKNAVGLEHKGGTSHITLVGGDRLPGKIISLDDKSLIFKSPVVGELTIPRAHLKSISPNPFEGELQYAGPYTSDGWMTLGYRKTKEQLEKEAEQAKKAEKQAKKDSKEEKEETSSSWIHSGAAFYNLSGHPLAFPEANLPDVGKIRFNASWKDSLRLTVAFNSDFTRVLPAEKEENDADEDAAEDKDKVTPAEGKENEDPVPEDEEEEKEPRPLRKERLLDLRNGKGFQDIAWYEPTQRSHADMFGTGYTLSVYSSYPSLYRNAFSETGTATQHRVNSAPSNVRLTNTNEAEFEIRYDRNASIVMLFINGSYAAQWNDLDGFTENGGGLGFINNSTNGKLRLSDVVITSWNGMTDSAKSMEHRERDVAILTNGTDRLSGQLAGIADGKATLQTEYAEMKIPVNELSKIILKSATALDLEDDETAEKFAWGESDPVSVLYKPFGKIQMIPASATATELKGHSPFLGEISLKLEPAVLLRFVEASPDISDWFDDL